LLLGRQQILGNLFAKESNAGKGKKTIITG
jgi:hypothetical protein